MTKRLQITIKGSNVQRCGFRKSAMEKAKDMQLRGSAMYINHDLRLDVEGDSQKVDQYAAWAEIGPEVCNINHVEKKELPLSGCSGFNIVHGIVVG